MSSQVAKAGTPKRRRLQVAKAGTPKRRRLKSPEPATPLNMMSSRRGSSLSEVLSLNESSVAGRTLLVND